MGVQSETFVGRKNTTHQSLTHFILYFVRATCFDLVGHPQVLQEDSAKSCLVLLQCGIPNVYKFLLQEHIVHNLNEVIPLCINSIYLLYYV